MEVRRLQHELGATGHFGTHVDRSLRPQLAHQMHLTTLPGDPLKVLDDRLRQPAMLIGDHKHHAFEATILQPTEGLVPGREFSLSPVCPPRISRCPSLRMPERISAACWTNTVVLTALEKQGCGQKER